MNHEQAATALTATSDGWRKSTYSQAANDCVEVNATVPEWVGVRDSKNPDGPALTVRPAAWATFLAGAAWL